MNHLIEVIVKPMERGQITLPHKFRQKLGISKDTLLNVTLEGDRLVIVPLNKIIGDLDSSVIKPKITKEKYLKILKGFPGNLWTGKDDIALAKMRQKEKFWRW